MGIYGLIALFVVEFVIGLVPGLGAWCTDEWIYPKCCFYGLLVHACLYFFATHLWKNEYFIQEDKVMEEARKQSETSKPDEKLDAQSTE